MFMKLNPKGTQENCMANIESVGSDIVGFGGPNWSRNSHEFGSAVEYGSLVNTHQKREYLSFLTL